MKKHKRKLIPKNQRKFHKQKQHYLSRHSRYKKELEYVDSPVCPIEFDIFKEEIKNLNS